MYVYTSKSVKMYHLLYELPLRMELKSCSQQVNSHKIRVK